MKDKSHNLTELSVNSRSTVQPNSLLRLGVFTPIANRNRVTIQGRSVDVSDDFRSLSIAKQEGYSQVLITGSKLNFDTDFRIWCGIVHAFAEYGAGSDTIELPFPEFAKMCGFKSRKINKDLRDRLDSSLLRLASQTIRFTNEKSTYIGHLIDRAYYHVDDHVVRLTADPKLWELYQIDHQVLLHLKVIEKLPRSEVAQCLYAFIHALPQNPIPLSFKRIRERLQLTSSLSEQNRTIRNAINKLKDIGYLDADVVRRCEEAHLIIHQRSHKLELLKDDE